MDVKTKNAHFYVQRKSSFGIPNAVIPFELAPLNEGNAFNLLSGIFTCPVPGIYHFQFSALKEQAAQKLQIFLQINGTNVGKADTTQSASGSYDNLSLSASFRLAAGDKVNLFNYAGELYDYTSDHHTHFSGWLVEEHLS